MVWYIYFSIGIGVVYLKLCGIRDKQWWWKNDKVESWRGGKMSKVEIILVEIIPISALYYRFHTISILQVRKLVIQVTSTRTSYKRRIVGPRQSANFSFLTLPRHCAHCRISHIACSIYNKSQRNRNLEKNVNIFVCSLLSGSVLEL